MNTSRMFFGVFAITIGVLLLLSQLGLNINFGGVWPFILLVPGVFFWVHFFGNQDKRSSSLLIPGTILIVYSLYFFFNEAVDYRYAGETSFIFTFGVALGFFAAYWFARQKARGMLITAWILTAAAAINVISVTPQAKWWPGVALVLVGGYLLYRGNAPKASPPPDSQATKQ